LVWLIANDLDYETARRIPQMQRFPFFEWVIYYTKNRCFIPGYTFPNYTASG
jgi:hypothetical protein